MAAMLRRASAVLVVMVLVAVPLGRGAQAQTNNPPQKQPQKPAPKPAQKPPPRARKPPRARAIELSGSVGYLNGYDLGNSTATLTPNVGSPTFTYFNTSTEVRSVPAVEGRVGYQLTRLLSVEGGLTYSRPKVSIALSADQEIPSPGTIQGDELSQFIIDASALANLQRLAFFKKQVVPFAMGGGGYLRQLHEDRVLVETGQIYHVGGGVKYFRPRRTGSLRQFGARGDARYYWRTGGFDIQDDRMRRFATVYGGVAYRF